MNEMCVMRHDVSIYLHESSAISPAHTHVLSCAQVLELHAAGYTLSLEQVGEWRAIKSL